MLTVPRLLRMLAPLLVVLGLAGCFKSSTPLIDAAQAKYPFATLTLKNGEGEISVVKRDGDVYRFIEDGKPDDTALLIRELGPDLYLVQIAAPNGTSDYLFARKQGSELIVRSDCKDLDPETLRAAGVEIHETGASIYECHFKDAAALVDLGKSPGIWANSTTTLTIVSIE